MAGTMGKAGGTEAGSAAVVPTRRWIVLASGTLAVGALSACVTGGSQGASAPASKQPATIRWRTPTTDAWPAAQALFAQQYPHITVEAVPQEQG
jgi:ABC-type glycerol-3-phosphate transport system substrate-binding protein